MRSWSSERACLRRQQERCFGDTMTVIVYVVLGDLEASYGVASGDVVNVDYLAEVQAAGVGNAESVLREL